MITEQDYLRGYSIKDYDRPSVAADLVIFRMRTSAGDSFRKDPESKLSLLLIKRGEHPFLGRWALPGGFLRMDETVEACALREAKEETGVTPDAMTYLGVFSAIDRDPRGRIISNAFTCILNSGTVPEAGSDASEAQWFDVAFEDRGSGACAVTLTSDGEAIRSELAVQKTLYGEALIPQGEQQLAFDHAAIIAAALRQLRTRAAEFELIFDFLPREFTLLALQKVQETLTGEPVAVANFRRKVAAYVEETPRFTQGAGHRPAKLYKRKD